jgi:predicted acetyltransferase
MPGRIVLLNPDPSHKEAAREFIAEFKEHASTPHGAAGLEKHGEDYEGWLKKLEREGDERTVEPEKVPASTWFAVRKEDNRIVGMINIRHRLNGYLLNRGGHIGYCVRPAERRKGYAVEILGLGLGQCRVLGLKKALVTCGKNNIPSARTIQHHGGILENEVFDEESSAWFQRYWIETEEAPAERDRESAEENGIIRKILLKAGNPALFSDPAVKLSMSEINTLLLELFRTKVRDMRPVEILRQYEQNRFTKPSELDPVLVHRFTADLLDAAVKYGYTALELSPVTVLGACSVIAPVDQNKVLSALRGTEVVSDATNALALYVCALKNWEDRKKTERLRYCAVHRHLRTQQFQGKNQLSHFILYGMVISGRDEGNLKFEKEALRETFAFYHEYLSGQSRLEKIRFIIRARNGGRENFTRDIIDYLSRGNPWDIREEPASPENNYYQGVQFKIKAVYKDTEYEIGDGGFVDWAGKLLQNKKERMLISGIGLERLIRTIPES